MCLFPPNKCSLAIRAFAYSDIAVAKSKPITPPVQLRGTMTVPEYPRTYALLIPVVSTNPAWNHESMNTNKCNELRKRAMSTIRHLKHCNKDHHYSKFSIIKEPHIPIQKHCKHSLPNSNFTHFWGFFFSTKKISIISMIEFS